MNEFKLNCETSGARLDKFISDSNIDLSRSAAVNLIENGAVLVNGLNDSKIFILSQGDVVVVCLRHRQVQHIRRLDVRHIFEYRAQLRQVVELGKAGLGSVARPLGEQFVKTIS